MPKFTVSIEESTIKKVEIEAENAGEARRLARDGNGVEVSSDTDMNVYEIFLDGRPVWDNDGNNEFEIPERCAECGVKFPDEPINLSGPFHLASCSLYDSE